MINLVDALEAILFVADAPTDEQALASTLGLTEGQILQAIEILEQRLKERGALQLVAIAGGYQLCTKPEFSSLIERFQKPQPKRLGRAALETLAIVAYQQPLTLAQIEAVRGVGSEYTLRHLMDRDLVREVGRKQVPGRPVLYGTTENFLHQFGLRSLSDLPAREADGVLPAFAHAS